jgi:hypothetical protein
MTSREAPTIARCDLTVRRDRFLATSCRERSISVCPLHPHFVSLIAGPSRKTKLLKIPYLRNTLLVLSSEKDSPCNATGVLALQEEGFGLAILESEDFAITTDVELALHTTLSAPVFSRTQSLKFLSCQPIQSFLATSFPPLSSRTGGCPYLSRVDLLAGEGIVVGTHVGCCVCIRRLC